jgi:hypothetical protein
MNFMIRCGEKKPRRRQAGSCRERHRPAPDGLELLGLLENAHGPPILRTACFESNLSIGEGEERVVAAQADVVAGMELRASLANNDRACADGLAAVDLDAEALCL